MGQSVGRAFTITEWVFPLVPPSYTATHKHLVHIPSEVDINVPAMLMAPAVARHELGSLVSLCVIYFHANACDIGQCLEDLVTFRDGALDGDAVMLCPEYPGYGLLRSYEPSVHSVNLVADAAWRFCTEDLGFEPEQIILWGRSIGTGPATALAHRIATQQAEKAEKTIPQAPKPSAPPAPKEEQEDDCQLDSTCLSPQDEEVHSPLPHVTPPVPCHCVGGLVLLAPFTSVSAVVEHHVPSRFVASVVGPMWNVLEMVQDAPMEEVPLCVVHPKADEVVPSTQGLCVYEKACSREKFGIWLCHATHNLCLLPEHLAITRRFLAKVTKSAKHRARRRWSILVQSKDIPSPLDPGGDVDSEEYAYIAEQLMQLGSTRQIEEGIWLSL